MLATTVRSFQTRSSWRIEQTPIVFRILISYVFILIATVPAIFRSRSSQVLVELALRQQLAIYSRRQPRPRLLLADRGFWFALSHLWSDWKSALVIVRPDTVV